MIRRLTLAQDEIECHELECVRAHIILKKRIRISCGTRTEGGGARR
jgi:hypothetical protein